MKEIKIEVYQHDNFLCGRVLEMPEELRNKDIIRNEYFNIESVNCPELTSTTLYLRGNDIDEDNNWFTYVFDDKETATNIKNYIESLITQWNEEHKEILTDKEKEYLAQVIRPFKDKITGIRKSDDWSGEGVEFIRIEIIGTNSELPSDDILLPFFEEGTMYKNMEANNLYTLKELGLE